MFLDTSHYTTTSLENKSAVYRLQKGFKKLSFWVTEILQDSFYITTWVMGVLMTLVFLQCCYKPLHSVLAMPQATVASKVVKEAKQPLKHSEIFVQQKNCYKGVLEKYETLSLLALRHKLSLSTLLSVNKITHLSQVQPEFQYIIPQTDGILHQVSSGETLRKLAKMYNISAETIVQTNHLHEQELTKGQELFIPGGVLPKKKMHQTIGCSFLFPVSGKVFRAFGKIYNSTTDTFVFNDGIDIVTNSGQEVYASLQGTVVDSGFHATYGYYIILAHKRGIHSFYGYLSGKELRVGQKVQQGDLIGHVGNSGYTNGKQLHFALLRHHRPIDPFQYLR